MHSKRIGNFYTGFRYSKRDDQMILWSNFSVATEAVFQELNWGNFRIIRILEKSNSKENAAEKYACIQKLYATSVCYLLIKNK